MSSSSPWPLPVLALQTPPTPARQRKLLGPWKDMDFFRRPFTVTTVGNVLSGQQGPLNVSVMQVSLLDQLMATALLSGVRKRNYTILAATNTRWHVPEVHVVPKTFETKLQRWTGRTIVPLRNEHAHEWEVFGREPEMVRRFIPPSVLQRIEGFGAGTFFEMQLGKLLVAVPGETPPQHLQPWVDGIWPLVETIVQR